jgi:hypothetical protein
MAGDLETLTQSRNYPREHQNVTRYIGLEVSHLLVSADAVFGILPSSSLS